MSDAGTRVLIVEDEPLITLGLTLTLEEMGLQVCETAATAADAIALAQEHRPSLVIMDVRLAGPEDGVDAAIAIHRTLGAPVIFLTGSREPETVERIRQDHPAAILFKPVLTEDLMAEIRRVLRTMGDRRTGIVSPGREV
jgi:DNA-binding NarL/FixJ family response regulator